MVEEWINSGRWTDESDDLEFVDLFLRRAAAADHSLGPTRVLAASLRIRFRELRVLLIDEAAQAAAEVRVVDTANRIRGRIDIVSRGRSGLTLIDVKSGSIHRPDGALRKDISVQLAVYSWLLHKEGESWARLAIASLRDGVRELHMQPGEIQTTIARLLKARESALRAATATPGQETCKFCSKRHVCGPHWSAVTNAAITDALEGTVKRFERGAGNRATILLDVDGHDSVLHLNHHSLTRRTYSEGDRLRAVRITRDSTGFRWIAGHHASVTVIDGLREDRTTEARVSPI